MAAFQVLGEYYIIYEGDSPEEYSIDHIDKRITATKEQSKKAIIEAFIYESGNAECNPEWFSIQGEKIYEAWDSVGLIKKE